MIETIIIVSLVLIIAILIFALIRGIKREEFYENFIISLKEKVNFTYNTMKEIDTHGSFEADDEVGTIFKSIESMVEDLNSFIQVDETSIYQSNIEESPIQ